MRISICLALPLLEWLRTEEVSPQSPTLYPCLHMEDTLLPSLIFCLRVFIQLLAFTGKMLSEVHMLQCTSNLPVFMNWFIV